MPAFQKDLRSQAAKLRRKAAEITEPSIQSGYLKLADYWDRVAAQDMRMPAGVLSPAASSAQLQRL